MTRSDHARVRRCGGSSLWLGDTPFHRSWHQCTRPVRLSVTHKSGIERGAYSDTGQSRETAPYDRVAWWRIAGPRVRWKRASAHVLAPVIVWHELVEEAGFHLGQSEARGGRESRLGYLGQGLAGAGDHLHADLYVPTGANISEEHRGCPQRTLDSRSTPSANF